ncbi:hypothetical protein HYALB_00003210 [Hymenoscyphus albidus]|uniref:Uncharacterized protein n=1 Tax=Hymenoscyphus albidus TaxID=595503 RepID=A0A9N9LWD3_9HELO|nr:hypothetical protein HYALB_00003210 [Hymenoscyphus albidus]
MLLTIKQPTHQGYKSFHDYTPPTPPSTSRFSPVTASTGSFPSFSSSNKSLPLPSGTQSITQPMSTPHRGLPPPAAMTLAQAPQPPSSMNQASLSHAPLSQPMGHLPAPPQQWQGAEESMREWLHAKAEEEKRRQEEEKTRQESLRLEQRKIEHDMLKTCLNSNIPPHMVPMVFAGMGGGNSANASMEWAQHYMAQAHQSQQQHPQQAQLLPSQQTSPEQSQRHEGRAHSQSFSGQPQSMTLPSTPIGPPGSQQTAGFQPSYQLSPNSRSRQIAQPQATTNRAPPTSHLPRLNTGEMHIQQPPQGLGMQMVPGSIGHPLQQTQSAQQQEPQSSPSIYFHHWQPPTSQAVTSSGNQPTTPSGKHPTSSPKKRKVTGPQQPAPPPTSQPQYTSPPFSQTRSSTPSSRRRGHSRQRSDLSARGLDSYGRPSSRHRHTEGSFSTQSMASSRPTMPAEQGQLTQPRRRSGGSNPVSSLLEQSDSRPQSLQSQQSHQRDQYSALPEMRHDERHTTPENDSSRRPKVLKRDGRD